MKKTKSCKLLSPVIIHNLICEDNCTSGFELYVYKTQKEMLNGQDLYCKKNNIERLKDSSFLALCLCTEKPYYKTINEIEYYIFGAMFLNLEKLDFGLLAHECYHCAMTSLNNVEKYIGNFNDTTGISREEIVAYRLQCYFTKILTLFTTHKIFIKIENEFHFDKNEILL